MSDNKPEAADEVQSAPNKHGLTFGGSLFSEAVLLLLASGISYLYSYKYEQAYLEHFYIGEQYIQLSVERMVGAALGLLTFAMLLFNIFDLIAKFEPGEKIRVFLLQFFIPIAFSMLAVFAYVDSGVSGTTIFLAIIALAFWLLALIVPWKLRKSKGSFYKAIVADVQAESEIVDRGIVQRLQKKYNSNFPLVIILLIVVGPSLASMIGALDARNQRTFSIVEENSSWLVVRRNGTEFLLTEYDAKNNKLIPNIKLVTVEKMGELAVRFWHFKSLPVRNADIVH
jgi:hypothetical protein